MSFILLSDVHLSMKNPKSRLDILPETQWEKLTYVFEFAARHSCPILQAGDLCDNPRSWYLLPLLASFLRSYQKRNVHLYCIFGQHDTYLYSETSRSATITGSLAKGGLLHILTATPTLIEGIEVVGASFGEPVPEPPREGRNTILVVHAPISTRELWPGHKYNSAVVYSKRHPYDLILCGDIHRKFRTIVGTKNKKYCVNTGPLLRREAKEYNFKHKPGFALWTPEATSPLKFINVPCKPATDVLTVEASNTEKKIQRTLNDLAGGLKQANATPNVNIMENLERVLQEHSVHTDSSTNLRIRNLLTDFLQEIDGVT